MDDFREEDTKSAGSVASGAPAADTKGEEETPPPAKKSRLRVFPPAVEFYGVEFGPLYVITVSVQNADTKVRRVRIRAPETNYFRLSYFPDVAVAPGLDAKFEVIRNRHISAHPPPVWQSCGRFQGELIAAALFVFV